MISRSSDDEFTRLIYQAVRGGGSAGDGETSGSEPSSSCSISALMAGEPLSDEQKRHLKQCSFCSRLVVRLAVWPPDAQSMTPRAPANKSKKKFPTQEGEGSTQQIHRGSTSPEF